MSLTTDRHPMARKVQCGAGWLSVFKCRYFSKIVQNFFEKKSQKVAQTNIQRVNLLEISE